MKSITLGEVAGIVGGKLGGPACEKPELRITGVNTLADAGEGEVSFLANQRYKSELESTSAAAVLISDAAAAPDGLGSIIVDDPYLAFAKLQRFFYPRAIASGQRHASAVIDGSAKLADDVDVGPLAVIGANVTIGSGTIVGPGCVIGENSRIGSICILHANSVIAHNCVLGNEVILQPGATVGADGFGYAWAGKRFLKIPQVGRVIIEDDVEIGANATVDRGAIGDTVIERGVKLDNMVQIAHNVRVGAYTVMASQVGISGSTKIGKGCQFGGQSGTAGHLVIGDGCKLAGQSGVIGDLDAGGVYAGTPAIPHRLWLKVSALMMKLPDMWKAQQK
ncbi:UDP-3-O-[3-hydroxymyristoyl] glucosamine N-acyltransferase [Mariprofundus ferrinatatus]|uniref:UDP-3-O-acylglucosamine N-acyltransferase n=1 Tax=Mariprofundus ferrinatatus TaxID=1921087 RepID=A0A2K8LDH7_9PROT|nr:UDP-3-O-(3-hydroxymyristoyl)glucosamine N-acyltransferase [Mariprofundus ferrinatatus]ATX82336.1 UDP-3-O-[3-hydroxymyristoyl] glucosamine N-acyltransferase [Mariprofundus ferrinatatus]